MKPRTAVFACLSLFVLVLAVFGQAGSFGFISFDDPVYVTRNQHVTGGLTAESVKWAFSTFYGAYWHPLTWLSLMLDVELFGVNPRAFHLVNIVIHGLSTALLFLFLYRPTGAPWKSAIAAALFAIHPLRVESVVWITERKDVLATLSWMLTLLAYAWYARRPSARRYAAVFIALSVGLLAKPMAVTLPFVLLLLDYWPLERLRRQSIWSCIREKIPLLLPVLASSAITLVATRQGGSVQSLETFSLGQRIANALVSYVAYIAKFVWPAKLALYYPHPLDRLAAWQVLGAAALLILVTVLAWRARRGWPWFPVGWFWYLGSMIPVIGLVQVSNQGMTDRFTYVPQIGLTILVVWSLSRALEERKHGRLVLGLVTGIVVAGLVGATWAQTRYWRSSESIYLRTLELTEDNYVVHVLLADHLIGAGRVEKATAQYERAIAIRPDFTYPHTKLADLYEKQGRIEESERMYTRALESEPENVVILNDYATLLSRQGRADEAIVHLKNALRLDERQPAALNNLGVALARLDRHDEAIGSYAKALALEPDYAEAHLNLGISVSATGRHQEALGSFQRAIELNPRITKAHYFLIRSYLALDAEDRAIAHFNQVAAIDEAMAHSLARMLKDEM